MNGKEKPDQWRDPVTPGENIIILTAPARSDVTSSQNPNPNAQSKTLAPNPNNDSTSPDSFFKTRLCHNWTRGACQYKQCSFAHGLHELRGKSEFGENGARVCKMYYRTGNCSYGSTCSYVHIEGEMNNGNGNGNGNGNRNIGSNGSNGGSERRNFYKVKPCFSWRSTGRCSYGANCIFLHGDEDGRKTGSTTESEKRGNISEFPEDSGRSSRNNIFTKHLMPQRTGSIQKSGSQKLQEMKKIVDIYGDWPE